MSTKFRNSIARGFTLVELMIVVAIIGILAAVAIPQFIKYIRRSKTTEAAMNIRKLFDSTVAYYEAEHAGPNGQILVKQFPATQLWQPAQGACYLQVGNKCAGAFVNWSASATWNALNFGMDDPFYYSYEAVQQGGNGSAVGHIYQLEASGDLNGNGVYSLFRRSATVVAGMSISGGSGLYTVNEIE